MNENKNLDHDINETIKIKNTIIDDLTNEIDNLRKVLLDQEQQSNNTINFNSLIEEKEKENETLNIELKKLKNNLQSVTWEHDYNDTKINALMEELTSYKKIIEDKDNELNKIKEQQKTLTYEHDIKTRTSKYELTDKQSYKSQTSSNPDICVSDLKPLETINDWNEEANRTLRNWYYAFKEISHSYQFILDRNYTIASKLNLASVVSSSALSIFAGFKLWVQNDKVFQSTSDIIMLVSNLVIAGITTMSKRYIDDNRNEKLRMFIEEVDKFMNLIYAQYCLSPSYRINAKDFFTKNNETYTRLMVSAPNLSIKEMEMAKINYILYRKSFHGKRENKVYENDTVEV